VWAVAVITHIGPLGRKEIHQTARAVMSELIGWLINMRNALKQDIATYYSLSEGNLSSHIICTSSFKTGMSLKQSEASVLYCNTVKSKYNLHFLMHDYSLGFLLFSL